MQNVVTEWLFTTKVICAYVHKSSRKVLSLVGIKCVKIVQKPPLVDKISKTLWDTRIARNWNGILVHFTTKAAPAFMAFMVVFVVTVETIVADKF